MAGMHLITLSSFMFQIMQLVPCSRNGQFFAWVVVEGIMLKVPITVPRVFYLNSKATISENFPGRRVNKILPHGRQSYNLFEARILAFPYLMLDPASIYFTSLKVLRFTFFALLCGFNRL